MISCGIGQWGTEEEVLVRIEIRTLEELRTSREHVVRAAEAAAEKIKSLDVGGLSFMEVLRFARIGVHPKDGETPLNLVEQLNQTFTYLVSFAAVDQLFKLKLADGGYHLNLGTSSGPDISSVAEGVVAAEVFTAVDPKNNQKLKKDIEKVGQTEAKHRFVFYYSPSADVASVSEVYGVTVVPLASLHPQ